MPEVPAIAFVTLGCPKNEVDSDRMAAVVEASAYRLVDDPAEADVVVLNTCSFIQTATEESIASALELAGEWVPARSGRKLIVAGCMPSRYGADLAEAMPEMLRLLKAQGYDVSNLRFKPMRNASSAGTSSMDLDLFTSWTRSRVSVKYNVPLGIHPALGVVP